MPLNSFFRAAGRAPAALAVSSLAAVATPSIAAADLDVDPEDDIAFSDTAVNDSNDESLVITNDGNSSAADLEISVFTEGPDADAFDVELQGCSESGCVLEPGEDVTAVVSFSPEETGAHSAELVIEHDDPDFEDDVVIALSGRGAQPEIELLSEDSMNFGDVRLGSSSDPADVEIRNAGSIDLEIESATLGGDHADDFAISSLPSQGEPPFSLGDGEEARWELVCEPTQRGDRSAVFTIDSNDPDEPSLVVILSCHGTEAELVADPTPISFEPTRVGQTATEAVELKNEGNIDLTVTSLSPSDDEFEVIDAPDSLVIPAGDSETIEIEFTPDESGEIDGKLTALVDEVDDPVEFAIEAEGIVGEFDLSDQSVDFGEVRVDQDPEVRTVTLTNTGAAEFEVQAPSIQDGGGAFSAFDPEDSLPRTLDPDGDSVDIEIHAHPTDVGSVSGAVVLETDIEGSTSLSIDVTANGIAPNLAVSPQTVDFGAHDVLASPAYRTVTVENPAGASADLEVEGAALAGPGADVYFIDDGGGIPTGGGDPLVLAPDESTDLLIGYEPTVASAGEPQAALVITTDLQDAEIPLFGRGIDREIVVAPQSVSFPETRRNPEAPPTKTVEIENHGEAALTLTAAVVGGPAPDAFQIDDQSLPATLANQQSLTLEITFDPAVASSAPLQADLLLESDDRAVLVPLSGLAVVPNLSLTPGRVDFGRTGVDVPVTLEGAVTIQNRDDEDTLVVEDVRLDGDDEAFELSGWDGQAEIDPSESLELDAVFTASDEGVSQAYVEVYLEGDPVRVAVSELRGEASAFRARGGGCHAATGAGAAGAGWLLLAAAVVAAWRRKTSTAACRRASA